jgi:NTE family protein
MPRVQQMEKNKGSGKKRVSLALQGGGSHGAFTWGVIDALLENDSLEVEGVSGTSAGGMNAAAVIQGSIEGGNAGAIKKLAELWGAIGEMGSKSMIKPSPVDKLTKNFSISSNPLFKMLQYINGVFSPYELNPWNHNPLSPLVEKVFDFNILSKEHIAKLFLCATHIASGKLKIFKGKELKKEAVLASACVPELFQAVEVDGELYWDGGFIGNPAIYPLIYECETPDIIVIQIRRAHDSKLPATVHDIQNRLGEITQNSCLVREMRSIAFISDLIDQGIIEKGKLKKLNMHIIRDDSFFSSIERSTGFCSDPDFLDHLYKAGKRAGKAWLRDNFESIGVKGTATIEKDFV